MESIFLIALLAVFSPRMSTVESANGNSALSRPKRYITFPAGASLSLVLYLIESSINSKNIFTQGVAWGLSYNLPNGTVPFQEYFYPRRAMQRRHRRDLYHKLEVIMNKMGFDGRACIFRALCEASRKLLPSENTVVDELLRIIFRFPLQELTHFEPEEHRLYHRAYRIGLDPDKECSDIFLDCPFSLIDMVIGDYSY